MIVIRKLFISSNKARIKIFIKSTLKKILLFFPLFLLLFLGIIIKSTNYTDYIFLIKSQKETSRNMNSPFYKTSIIFYQNFLPKEEILNSLVLIPFFFMCHITRIEIIDTLAKKDMHSF